MDLKLSLGVGARLRIEAEYSRFDIASFRRLLVSSNEVAKVEWLRK